MATAKHTAPAKKAAKPMPVKAPVKKAAPKADHVIRAPAKATVHKAAQVMAASKSPKPQVKAAGRVLSAAAHKGQHTTGKEVKAIRVAEKALAPRKPAASPVAAAARKTVADAVKRAHAPAAKKAAAPAPKPRQEVANLVVRESKESRERREATGRMVTKSIMAVPDARTKPGAKKAEHVSHPHMPPAPTRRDPNRIVEDLKAQVRQATAPSPAPTAQPAATPVQPWTAEQERSFPVDQSINAVRPHSTPNVSGQAATEAAAGTRGAPVTLAAATRAAPIEPAPVQRVVASTPAETPQRTVKELPHGLAALAASTANPTTTQAGTPVTVPAQRAVPRTEWQGGGYGAPARSTAVDSGWPHSAMAKGNGSSAPATRHVAPQTQPGLIERRFEVFSAGMGSHRWRLMDATTGQLVSMGRDTFGTPGEAEGNAAQEAKLYKPGTCVIVRV